MKLNAKDVLIPTLVLFLVSLLVTAALAGTRSSHRRKDRGTGRAGCAGFPPGGSAESRKL